MLGDMTVLIIFRTVWTLSGSKWFDSLIEFPKEIFEKVNFEISPQMKKIIKKLTQYAFFVC